MEKKKILVVDDEQDLCEILLYNLNAAGFLAEAAYSGEMAWDRIVNCKSENNRCFDLLLLDVMMPGMSGFELAERLKSDEQTSHMPIIFLTAKDTEDDTLQGFGLGADDYVTKPFSVREVVARVKAVLARSQRQKTDGSLISFEGLVLDLGKKTTTVDGNSVWLTKTEFELLGLLLRHRGQVFSRQQIFDAVWPEDVVVSDRTVDVNITRMRKKIGRYGSFIVSRQGFGYVFEL
ncbi:MAG: response regulator transcription factor [Prevotella sp.]|nr:response regulator transcription factor [Prevotella sp.]